MRDSLLMPVLLTATALTVLATAGGTTLLNQDTATTPAEPAETGLNTGYKAHIVATAYRDLDNDCPSPATNISRNNPCYETVEVLGSDYNTVTDNGLDWFAGAGGADVELPAGASEAGDAAYLGLTNDGDTCNTGDTVLGKTGEITTGGLARHAGTNISLGIGKYSTWHTWTASSTFSNVNQTAIFYNGTDGSNSIVACDSITSTNLDPDDKITSNFTFVNLTRS